VRHTALKGHKLMADGWPHDAAGRMTPRGDREFPWGLGKGASSHPRNPVGRAKCECGWLSDPVGSGTQRRQAHRDHKNTVKTERILRDDPKVHRQ
jgi:hypothetical protein